MLSGPPHFVWTSVPSAYGRDIEEDIIADTSGHFKKMLIVLLQVSSLSCWYYHTVSQCKCSGYPTVTCHSTFNYWLIVMHIVVVWWFQGTRDESGVVNADLVEQDAQVRVERCSSGQIEMVFKAVVRSFEWKFSFKTVNEPVSDRWKALFHC